MTDTPNTHAEQERKRQEDDRKHRGAGSGEHANATRGRKSEDENEHKPGDVTEYPEGDPEKGRLDVEEQAECITLEQIPMRDRRAYLVQQAERNEAANDELNAIQVEQNKRVQFAQSLLQDPDVMRETSMDQAKAQLQLHDPEYVRSTRDQRREMRREARLRGRGHSSKDFMIAGPGPEVSSHTEHHNAPAKQQVKSGSGDGK
jgi:hypothetical protein